MKKLRNLGKALGKEEQQSVTGGGFNPNNPQCGFVELGQPPIQCPPWMICVGGRCVFAVL